MEADSKPESKSPASEQEAILQDYYASREPQTTHRYPLKEFIGSVRIQESPTAGRGLFLDVLAETGEILLISNNEAACIRYYKVHHARSSMDDPPTASTSSSRSIRHRIPEEVHQQLATDLASRISSHRKGLPEVYRYLDHENDTNDQYVLPTPHVDLYHDHRKNKQSFDKQPIATVDPEVPQERVWSIVAKNASYDDIRGISLAEPLMEEKCEFWGIWLLPSFINHSCTPNCNRLRVGEAIVIRAAKNIPAGDELFLPYFDIFQPFPLRKANAELWNFRCSCRRCQFESSLGKDFRNIETRIIHFNRLLAIKWYNKKGEGRILMDLRDQLDGIEDAIRNRSVEKTQKRNQVATKMRRCKITWDDVLKIKSPLPRKYADFFKLLQKFNLEKEPNISDEAYMEQVRQGLGEDDEQTTTETKWVRASFIDVYIALYAGSAKATVQARHRQTHQVTAWQTECRLINVIFEIIRYVHPGNLLGQEFSSIFLDALEATPPDCGDEETIRTLQMGKAFMVQFTQAYYGLQITSPGVLSSLIRYG